ncbi:MAG: UvrD-helicase domain-containing protein [Bacteroidales bacterium]|nr:UvrD-helicase domain-containing protein [Bacteroidales bacterium]
MSQLKVIRASAGSGKTFSLTNEYLALLFRDADYFMHILAVTFTNKATEEMKSRIIRELFFLSSGRETGQLYELMKKTGLRETALRGKARNVLKKILHQYSWFSVGTIDSFFQRIIRSFTRELGIQNGYMIELDTDTVTEVLIERLLGKLENDRALLDWLMRYAEILIEQGGNWNFRDRMTRLGKEIFREAFFHIQDATGIVFSDRHALGEYQSALYAMLATYRKEYTAIGRQAVELIESFNLSIDDFFRKEQGPAGFLYRIAGGDFKEPTATAMEAADDIQKWFTQASPKKELIASAFHGGLQALMQQAVQLYRQKKKDYYTADAILKNLFTLGILSDIMQLSSDYCNENNVFLLSEAAVFLNQIIRENDTPFIYEKTGCWYHHFMIDEFQDTSLMQWKNFRPLISNSLSQDYDNLIVGDVKQSIYRWRNSDWEILAEGIQQEYRPESLEIYTLQENWRSGRKIIEFNNTFFIAAAAILQGACDEALKEAGHASGEDERTSIKSVYADVIQKPGMEADAGGLVQINFIREDEGLTYDDIISGKLIRQLCDLQDRGYTLNQISIIVRKNSEAEQLAGMLLKHKNEHHDGSHRFDVISDDALRLGSSSVVGFIIALLQYFAHPDDAVNKYHIISDYNNYLRENIQEQDFDVPENINESWNDIFTRILPGEFFILAGYPGRISLTETIQKLMHLFRLDRFEGELAYIQAFQDLVLEFSKKHASDLIRFLEFWKETGIKRTVAAPAGQDAIRILTIHKAKGLEFDIVIMPYCDWGLNSGRDTILWCDARNIPGSRFDVLPVYYSSRLTDTHFDHAYFSELRRQYVDNLNLLYVSFTRARKGLFVYCPDSGKDGLTDVSDLVSAVLNLPRASVRVGSDMGDFQQYLDRTTGFFSYGSLPEQTPASDLKREIRLSPAFDPAESSGDISERIRIAYQGNLYLDATTGHLMRPVNQGKIMHEIFSGILQPDDIKKSIRRICLQGKIDGKSAEQLLKLSGELLKDIQVLSWFSGDWKVLTEAEIILPDGSVKRPDRVLVHDNNAVIIDFKFGRHPGRKDELQVKGYVEILKKMGYEQVEGYLWYVMTGMVKKVA